MRASESNVQGMTIAERAAHDRAMATPPVAYRGYRIQVVSYKGMPFMVGGRALHWGFIVVHGSGSLEGCNAGPGATWGETIGEAKTIIDCLHEAGPRPAPGVVASAHEHWNKRFWSLMSERRPSQ